MAIQDPKIVPQPAWWKLALNAVYMALTFGKAQGWFSKGGKPKL